MNKYATAWGTAYHDELFLCKLSFLLFLLFINDLNSGASFSHFCVSFNNPSGGEKSFEQMSLESRRVLCKNLGQEWGEDTSKDEGKGA